MRPISIVGNSVVLTQANALNINGIGHTSGAPVANPLQLIAWQAPDAHAHRLVITLAPIQRQGSPQTPYFGTPNQGARFGTPINASLSSPTYGNPNVGRAFIRLQWGAGGVSQQTVLEYPILGGSFGIVASNVKIDVWCTQDPSLWTSPADYPVFTAWVGPGEPPPNPMPLRMYVQGENNIVAANVTARYGFKSTNVVAITMNIGVNNPVAGTYSGQLVFEFCDSSGNPIDGYNIAAQASAAQFLPVSYTFRIPPNAVAYQITNLDTVSNSVAISLYEEILLA
jgi:hypothetical protein